MKVRSSVWITVRRIPVLVQVRSTATIDDDDYHCIYAAIILLHVIVDTGTVL